MGSMVVDGIPRQPLPYGLFSVLVPRISADAHWEYDGVTWETLTCEPASGIGVYNCENPDQTTGLPKGFTANGDVGEADVFHVYGAYRCTPVGHTLDYARDRAAEHLQVREEAVAEQAIWTGDLDTEGFAANAEEAVSGAVSITRAIGALEQWIARAYGSQGVLHMTREAAVAGIAADALVVVGNQVRTVLGTPVVAGTGYPGTGPAGQEPTDGQTYIYVTPGLLGYRSEVFPGTDTVQAGFDKTNNNLTAVAERAYSIGWDPCGTAYALANFEEAV